MRPQHQLAMKYVRIRKTGVVTNAQFNPGHPESYPFGLADETHSLPLDYWLEGWLVRPLAVGKQVLVLRYIRDRIICPGRFVSTPVVAIHNDHEFSTLNSVYQWKEIPLLSSDWSTN